MDFSFIKLNIEKIGIKLKSFTLLKGEVKIDVDKRKVEIENFTQIREQKNLNAPITNNTIVLVSGTSEAKEVIEKITGELDIPLETEVPKLSTGQASLPEVEVDGKPKKLLKQYLTEHRENPDFFLDIDGWLFQHNVYYGVINLLGKIGDIEDLTFVEESINKETINLFYWNAILTYIIEREAVDFDAAKVVDFGGLVFVFKILFELLVIDAPSERFFSAVEKV
jgi:hypothetical protein